MIYEGFTEPRHDIMVAATEIGRIEAVEVEVGDRVEAGQEVGHLEDALQASSVKIGRLQAEMTGELEAARAESELHRSRTDTLRKLAADGMARPDELVRAETDLRIASARLVAAEEQVTLRKLELERYKLQFERRRIRVPMDGVISEVFHKPGEYLTPGDPAVVRLLVMDKLFGVFNIPVEDTAFIKVGSPVKVYLRSSSTTLEATITSIAPDIDGESGTVQIRVELDNTDRRLLSGDRCTLRLTSQATVNSARRPPDRASFGRTKSR
jgi:RND family efflux transporter MFP subunit